MRNKKTKQKTGNYSREWYVKEYWTFTVLWAHIGGATNPDSEGLRSVSGNMFSRMRLKGPTLLTLIKCRIGLNGYKDNAVLKGKEKPETKTWRLKGNVSAFQIS